MLTIPRSPRTLDDRDRIVVVVLDHADTSRIHILLSLAAFWGFTCMIQRLWLLVDAVFRANFYGENK